MKCPSTADLFAQPELARSPHVQGCPRCDARLRGLEKFLQPSDGPSQALLADVERELRQRLASDIRTLGGADARRRRGLRAPTRARSLLFAGAAVASLALLFWWQPFDSPEIPTMRSGSGAESPRLLLNENSSWSGSVLRLEWSAVPGAENYQVVVYDSQLRELLSEEIASAGSWEFTVEGHGAAALWVRVRALGKAGPVLESELVAISLR